MHLFLRINLYLFWKFLIRTIWQFSLIAKFYFQNLSISFVNEYKQSMYPIIYHVKLHKFLSYNSCQTRSWRTKACSTSPPLNYLTQHVRHMYRESKKKVAKGENKASTNNACLFNAIIHHHPHHVLFHYVAFLPLFVV